MKEAAEDEQPMYCKTLRQTLELALLATLVAVALSACGGNNQQAPELRPLPEDEKALRPGEYRSEEFEPSFSFRVGEGWSNVPPEGTDELLLTRGHEVGWLGFANAQEVYESTKTGLPVVVDAPEDLVGWFQKHPYLRTDEPKPVTVGGVEGDRFDVVLGNVPEDYRGACGRECVITIKFSDGTGLEHHRGERVRLMVLDDVDGQTVVTGFGSPVTEFDKHAPEAQKVIDTVEWRGL
jgi:hypothetical protein